MNTKSIVAVVKKPKVVPRAAKAVVKKPKATPKVAKAVVKKPRATPKAAKAVVKKPKATPKATPRAVPKVAKAVVKKPRKYNNINGGVGSVNSGSLANTNGVLAASASRMSNGLFKIKSSRAVTHAPQVSQNAPIKSDKRPSPRELLYKIKDDYFENFVKKRWDFKVYDLIILVNNMAENLNKFFEDFLLYYPNIIFKYPANYKHKERLFKRSLLNYQQDHLDILNIIVKYIKKRISVLAYLSLSSKNIYSGVLDGSQEGKTEYDKGKFKFFDSSKLENLPEHIKKILKNKKFSFGDDIFFYYFGYRNKGQFYYIAMKLNLILIDFLEHIQLMEINEPVDDLYRGALQEYIQEVKDTAIEILVYFENYKWTLSNEIYNYTGDNSRLRHHQRMHGIR
jgi:hypothetical protein